MADTTKKINLVRTNGADTEYKEGYIGFCKLAFALGCIAPISRKDWKNAVIMFCSPIVTCLALVLLCDQINGWLYLVGFHLYGFISGFVSDDVFFLIIFILSFLGCRMYFGDEYNKKYTEQLIKKGFRPADEYAEQMLKEAGIKFNDDEAETQATPQQSPQPSLNSSVKISKNTKTANDLVKEGFALLEHSGFEQAEELFGQALDINSGISSAYIGALMAEQKCRNLSELANSSIALENDEIFQKALDLASPKNKQILEKCIQANRAKRRINNA